MREKYMEMKMLQEHMEKVQEHIQLLQKQGEDLGESKDALLEIQKSKLNSKVLAPIANGIFVTTTLTNNETLLVNVGADTVVEKTIAEVVELLEEQQISVTQKAMETQQFLQELHEKAMAIYKDVEENIA